MELKVGDAADSRHNWQCVFMLGCVCVCVLQTAEVVQFILVKDQKKIPIRRAGRAASANAREGLGKLVDLWTTMDQEQMYGVFW